jgi:hypothetical protein
MGGATDAIDVELITDSAGGWPAWVRVFSGGTLSHDVALDEEVNTPDERTQYLFAVDLDGDGVRELMIRKFLAMRGNTAYQVFRFDRASWPPTQLCLRW